MYSETTETGLETRNYPYNEKARAVVKKVFADLRRGFVSDPPFLQGKVYTFTDVHNSFAVLRNNENLYFAIGVEAKGYDTIQVLLVDEGKSERNLTFERTQILAFRDKSESARLPLNEISLLLDEIIEAEFDPVETKKWFDEQDSKYPEESFRWARGTMPGP